MTYREAIANFSCAGEHLLGIIASPAPGIPACNTGIVIIVGGPQYRAGSHRQFVLLARELATDGYPVLRFDHRGMGDSSGDLRNFETVAADVGVGIDALMKRHTSIKKLVLFGLCDGASAALLYIHAAADPRVTGLCLLNPWVRSETSLARTHVKHYYFKRLQDKGFWTKLLKGGIGAAALRELKNNVSRTFNIGTSAATPKLSYQNQMAVAWRHFAGPILLLNSENDLTAKEFLDFADSDPQWSNALRQGNVSRHQIVGADHTLSSATAMADGGQAIRNWLAASN